MTADNRRDKGDGGLYQLADGRWRAALTVGYAGGKRQRRTWTRDTKAEAKKQLDRAKAQLAKGLPLADEKLTLAAYAARWLGSPPLELRANTLRIYESIVRLHLAPGPGHVPGLGHIRLMQLSVNDVRKYMAAQLALGRSPAVVAMDRRFLRRLLADAEREEIISRNVAALAQAPAVKRVEIEPLTPEEMRQFLMAIEGDRLVALYTLTLALGLRSGEVRGLRWDDVDPEKLTVRIRQQMTRPKSTDTKGVPTDTKGPSTYFYELAEVKTARGKRTLGLPEALVPILRAHRDRQQMERKRAGPAWQGDHWGLVFCTADGSPISPQHFGERFHKLLEAAGVRRQRPHDLRHAAASYMLATGVRMDVVRDVLGHSGIGVTVDTYGHVAADVAREATTRANDMLWGASG